MRKVSDSLDERKVKEEDQGGQTDGGPVVKATLPPRKSPHVGTTLAPSLPISYPLHHAQRGTMASYRLAAVFGSRPLLHPAFLHLTPEGGTQGSDPHLELVFSAIANATLNSGAVKDRLLLHSSNAAKPLH